MIIEWTQGDVYQHSNPQWEVYNCAIVSEAEAVEEELATAIPRTDELVLSSQYNFVTIVSDGSNYNIISEKRTVTNPVINLDGDDYSLEGKYQLGNEYLVLCDATDGDLTISIPDARLMKDTVFQFNRKDEVYANVVTLDPEIDYQKIQNENTQTLRVGDSFELFPGANHWWVT